MSDKSKRVFFWVLIPVFIGMSAITLNYDWIAMMAFFCVGWNVRAVTRE